MKKTILLILAETIFVLILSMAGALFFGLGSLNIYQSTGQGYFIPMMFALTFTYLFCEASYGLFYRIRFNYWIWTG